MQDINIVRAEKIGTLHQKKTVNVWKSVMQGRLKQKIYWMRLQTEVHCGHRHDNTRREVVGKM